MNYVAFNPVTGRIHQKGFTDLLPLESPGLSHLEIDHAAYEALDTSMSYVANSVLVPVPLPTSPYHVFDYALKQWIDPRTPQDYLNANRAQRNALLLACDWTQLPDVPAVTQAAWSAYRQALRDITNQSDQTNVIWPTSP